MSSAPISCLFAGHSPSAVGWFVIAVVIDSLDRVQRRRTWPHIPIKGLKGITPFVTHFYAATAIFVIAGAFWIVAPVQHRAANAIFGKVRHSVAGEIDVVSFTRLAMHGGEFTVPRKTVGTENANISTLTATLEVRHRRSPFRLSVMDSKNGEFPDLMAGLYSSCSHDMTSEIGCVWSGSLAA
jgi:hypothetical protein